MSGFVVGLSVIPETAGFAIMVGLDVGVAFYTTFYMAFVLSLFGARKAMINAAAGSVALILVGVVKNYGLEYAGVATLMAGVLQILLGYLKIGNLLKFIPLAFNGAIQIPSKPKFRGVYLAYYWDIDHLPLPFNH
ncbi:hypothetical protein KH0074_05980 [Helicobacter pylori]